MYKNINELVLLAEDKHVPIWKVVLESEQMLTSRSEEEIFEELNQRYQIMTLSAKKAIKKPRKSKGSFINGLAKQQYEYSKEKQGLCGELLNRVMAMAAAAAVQMIADSAENEAADQIQNAVAFSLMNVMGLVCDPVAGMVQVPCAQRNASGAVNALVSADFALAGMKCLIPVDEVIEAMYQVGRQLPNALKETSLGGIAATDTGKRLAGK